MAFTITHFELHLDVQASEEEATFARLFHKYFVPASRQLREAEEAAEASERDRSLGDRAED